MLSQPGGDFFSGMMTLQDWRQASSGRGRVTETFPLPRDRTEPKHGHERKSSPTHNLTHGPNNGNLIT